jgi:branched-subunit amino acid transport protein
MIGPNYFATIVFFLALGTFSIRCSIILLSSKVKISEHVKEIFSFIPAAVLPALIMPMAFFDRGEISWMLGKEKFIILIIAAIISYFSRSMLLTVLLGLVLLYGARVFF